MASTRTRDAMLTVVGFAAWLLYILGCASFSPDDSKVLFPSNDPKTGGPVVAMYDRAAHTSRALLALPVPDPKNNSDAFYVRSLWTPDGSRVVSMWIEGDHALRVMVLPLTPKEPARLLAVADLGNDVPSPFLMPPPIVGSRLFISEKTQIRRVDLESGAEEKKAVDGEPLLVGVGNRIYYGRTLPDEGTRENRVEFGLVDANTLGLTPMFETSESTQSDTPFFAVSRDGRRLGVLAGKEHARQVLVFETSTPSAPPRRLSLGTEAGPIDAGEFQWSRDGSTVYCVFRKEVSDDQYQFGVLEVPVDGKAVRQIPFFRVSGSGENPDVFALQVDVSHDGKTLAAASTYLQTPFGKKEAQRLKPEDLALYFVDLSRQDRRITKVPIPPLPAPPVTMARQ
jgi:hypothetical protein